MAEPSIPVSAIRKALAIELSTYRTLMKRFDKCPLTATHLTSCIQGQKNLIDIIEFYTGTKILRQK